MSISQEIVNIKEQYQQLNEQISNLVQKQSQLVQLFNELINENKYQSQEINKLEKEIRTLKMVSEPSPKLKTIINRPWKISI